MAKRGKDYNRKRKNKQLDEKRKLLKYKSRILNKIRKYDDPILSEKCTDVTDKESIEELMKNLKRVLFNINTVVGLSAPQIGYTKRVFVIRPKGPKDTITLLINPQIIEHSEEKENGEEGCLSYPNIFADIERYKMVVVQYLDEDFELHKKQVEGLEARIVQHEIDHLNGVCFVGDKWKSLNKKGSS